MSFFRIEDSKLIWEREGEIIWIDPYRKDAIRCRASKSMKIHPEKGTQGWVL